MSDAFAKINVPFKDKMCELLEKTIVIWLDTFHLITSHIYRIQDQYYYK